VLQQGGHKIGQKESLSFPGISRATNVLFPQVTATKSDCNNELHQRSFHINASK